MLNLVGDKYKGSIGPDYGKSMVQVFKEAAKDIIERQQKMDILLAGTGINRKDGLPSWVPDWRREANNSRPTLFVNKVKFFREYFSGSTDYVVVRGHGYAACAETKADFEFDVGLDTLSVSAVHFDTIADVTDVFQVDEDRPLWEVNAYGWRGPELEREESLQACIDSAHDLVRRSKWVPTEGKALEDQVAIVLAAGTPSGTMGDIIRNVMRRRRFLVTETSRLGIGPSRAAKGDCIFIIAGCNYPMILRKQDEENQYALVGEAYSKSHASGEC